MGLGARVAPDDRRPTGAEGVGRTPTRRSAPSRTTCSVQRTDPAAVVVLPESPGRRGRRRAADPVTDRLHDDIGHVGVLGRADRGRRPSRSPRHGRSTAPSARRRTSRASLGAWSSRSMTSTCGAGRPSSSVTSTLPQIVERRRPEDASRMGDAAAGRQPRPPGPAARAAAARARRAGLDPPAPTPRSCRRPPMLLRGGRAWRRTSHRRRPATCCRCCAGRRPPPPPTSSTPRAGRGLRVHRPSRPSRRGRSGARCNPARPAVQQAPAGPGGSSSTRIRAEGPRRLRSPRGRRPAG